MKKLTSIIGMALVVAMMGSAVVAQVATETTAVPPATPAAEDTATQVKKLRAQRAELDKQRSALRKQLDAIRGKYAKAPEAAEVSKAYDDAEAAYQAAKKEDPKIVEARKPYEAAGEALAKALKALPQAEAAKAADKAYDDARHAKQ